MVVVWQGGGGGRGRGEEGGEEGDPREERGADTEAVEVVEYVVRVDDVQALV